MIIETETGYMAGTTAATGKLRKSELYIMKDLIWDLRQMESRRRMSGETIPISAPSISHTDYLLENQHPSQTITR